MRAIHLCRAYDHIVLVHYRDVLEVCLLFSLTFVTTSVILMLTIDS